MKVRIKREQLVKYFDITLRYKWGIVGQQLYDYGLEISESDIVKEKSNCEKWEEVFMKICDISTIEMIESWAKDKADLFDLNGIDATQAYEKIVDGK